MTPPLLRLEGLNTHIGDYHILQGVNLSMTGGGVAALLGRNGAGKTTTLRSIMGLSRASGAIIFDGRDIVGFSTAAISRLGIGYVPESLGELHPVSTGHRRQPEDLGIVLGIRLCPTRFRKSK